MGLFDKIFGGSKSSSSPSTVWKGQAPFLESLYQRAANASQAGSLTRPTDPLSQLGGSLLGQGQQMANQLQMFGQQGNPWSGAQLQNLQRGFGDLFRDQIAPSINSQFSQAGPIGGSRQGVALGQAAGQVGQAFGDSATNLMAQNTGFALDANTAGLQSLGGLFGMGNAAMFGSLPGLQSLLGSPTVLGGGSQSSSTDGILGALSKFVGG